LGLHKQLVVANPWMVGCWAPSCYYDR